MHLILFLPIQVLFFLQRYNIFIYPPNFSPNINDFFSIRLQTSSSSLYTKKITSPIAEVVIDVNVDQRPSRDLIIDTDESNS